MRRPAPRPELWPALLAAAAVLLLIGSYLRPALPDPGRLVPGPYGGLDAVLQSGILEWTARHWHEPAVWVSLPIFWPDPGALAYMDGLLGQALLLLPLRPLIAGRAALGYDLALLVSLALAALACAFLWRRAGEDLRPAGAALAGGTAALCLLGSPYVQSQLGHLNQVPGPLLLLSIGCLLAANRGGRRAGAAAWGWGAALGLQAAWGWYGLAQGAVAGAVLAAWGVAFARRDGERPVTRLKRLAGPALLAAALAAALSIPYWGASAREPAFERSVADVRAFSADLNDFLNLGRYRGGWLGLSGARAEPADPRADEAAPRRTLNPGWTALALAAAGWGLRGRLDPRRRREGNALLLMGLVGLVLAFGDSVRLPGTDRRLLLPFGALHELFPPARAFRAVWRFSLLPVAAVAWWAGAGMLALAGPAGARRPGLRALLASAAVLLLLLESLPAPLPAVALPPARGAVADPLAALPPGAVLTLPAPPEEQAEDLREALWLHRALDHGHPVTGGVSGWVPPHVRELRRQLAAAEVGGGDPAPLLRELVASGVRYAAVAADGPGDERAGSWLRALSALGWRALPVVEGVTVLLPPGEPAAPGGR